ncbi:hypothetical protein [Botrimarina mediterranea]|uniref:Uncharacterized protein n=1 Tax=Botrimarina mediterranea TaxID=2528022 RepID=A0A518K8Z2_9BACT|nr:hypothetical protein [Botrimarina mediterranea]QDV74268.1 hypothetical protein Spa11_24680 [Botrimarina mediterranea]
MTQPSRDRSGSVYVAVLGAAMIVATIALTVSAMGRLALRSASDQRDRRQAQVAARSGVEFMLGVINQYSDWRSRMTSGVESGDLISNHVRFSWSVTDVDGDLADDPLDHAVIRAIGKSGEARSALTVTVEPFNHTVPLSSAVTCLESALHADDALTIAPGAVIQRSGDVTSNSEAAYFASPAKSMPSDHVFDYYVSRGTTIPIGSLTGANPSRFRGVVLSRHLNPFGETNPWGIYVIDCEGADVELSLCRVYGTLVLLNAGPNTAISDVAIIQPEADNYPSLMVQGDLSIDLQSDTTGAELQELSRINYNPPGAPYDGVEDSDQVDNARPATLDGIVYVTGTATISDDAVIRGCLVAGNVTVNADKVLTLEYRPYARDYPPPGFTIGAGVRPLPGSWREVGL